MVFVYDNRNNNWKFLDSLGSYTCGFQLGEFSFVTGLGVIEDDGSLIVCDYLCHRIQLF